MSTTLRRKPVRDDYLALVRAFPLRVLRSEAEQEEAVRVHSRLVGRSSPKLTQGERDYADALARFLQDFDERSEPFLPQERTALDRLRYLVEQSQIAPAQLRTVLKATQPLVSMLLVGKRPLTVAHIRSLSDYFKVDPSYFI